MKTLTSSPPLVSSAASIECSVLTLSSRRAPKLPPMVRDEQQKLLASGPVQGEAKKAMSGTGDAAVPPSPCDYCSGMPAVVYCRADSARLCLRCDRHIHGANTVSSRHARGPLCTVCRAAAASFRRAARFLCSNCNFEVHRHDGAQGEPLHDRATVEGYTGCPSLSELAAILGVDNSSKVADEVWWSFWEEPQVFSLDDVIVPTTSCHGLQPLLTPSSPKNRSSPGRELNEEVLRQLGEPAKSEAAAYVDAELAGDQLPSWASSEYAIGHGDFGPFGAEASHEAASMAVPSCEHEAWITIDFNESTDACEAEVAHKQAPVSSAAEPYLSSYVEIRDLHSMSCSNSNQDPATAAVPTKALPKKGGYDVSYPDRCTMISRYKEKRKNRRFDKQIRYESRKARADGRLRTKGRFSKSSKV